MCEVEPRESVDDGGEGARPAARAVGVARGRDFVLGSGASTRSQARRRVSPRSVAPRGEVLVARRDVERVSAAGASGSRSWRPRDGGLLFLPIRGGETQQMP